MRYALVAMKNTYYKFIMHCMFHLIYYLDFGYAVTHQVLYYYHDI
jgi:hypothetical protein